MNGYDLSRNFVDFSFENPSKIKPNHYALYFFAIEHCNRLGWKKEFGLPTTMTMEAIGIKSYNTYINTFNDLVEFGFFTLIERSKNQYSANIIALSNFNKALEKALDKAFIKHTIKHCRSTRQSIDSINKQINKEPLTTPPIKEDVINDIFLSKYLPKYKTYCNQILKDTLTLENLNRMHKISDRNDILKSTIEKYLRLFLSQVSISQEKHENIGKFNTHFSNYLRKQPKIEIVSPKQKEQRYV